MENIKSYLSFTIGSEYYAANVKHVQNIIEYSKITKVPDMPVYMLGVINLRGQVLPVVDARIKFGVENREIATNTCILVMDVQIDKQEVFVGMLVDGVSEVIEIKDKDIQESPSIGTKIRNEFISGLYHDTEKFIMILEMNKVLATSEMLSVQSLTETIKTQV